MTPDTIKKIDKYRRVLDWIGIIASFAAVFYVDSMYWKVAFAAFGFAGLFFTLFKMDEKIKNAILRKMLVKKAHQ